MRTRSTSLLLAFVLPLVTAAVAPPHVRAATLAFSPTADASVNSAQASKNFGRTSTLPARQTASATIESLLTFQVAGVTGTVTGVRLRVNATDTSPDGGTIVPVLAAWSEASVTWRTAPALGSRVLAVIGSVSARGWHEIQLDPTSITSDGTYSFAITSGSTDQVAYSSREASNRPQLIVEFAPRPTTTPTLAPAPASTQAPAATSVVTLAPADPPTAAPSALPTDSAGASPSATATSAPALTFEPTPLPPGSGPSVPPSDPEPFPTFPPTPPVPTASPSPAPTPPPPGPPDADLSRSLLISHGDLLARPTTGDAWATLAKDATGPWPAMSTSNQDAKHARLVLAGALYAARTGDPAIRDRVAAALHELSAAPWYTDMLALARQLSGYVIAADLIGYRDPAFVAWVDAARTRVVVDHSRWTSLSFTAGNTAGNWGTWSLASLTAADLYLGDAAGVERDWSIFAGYGVPFASGWSGGPFIKTAAWDPAFSSVASDGSKRLPIGIDVDGALVEDLSRSDGATLDAVGGMYVFESVRAITTTSLLLRQAGYDVTGVTDGQLRRLAEWLRATPYADSIDGTLWGFLGHGLGPWARYGLNELLGTSYPAEGPTNTDRHFGYTDWLWP